MSIYTLSSLPAWGQPVTLLVGLEDQPDGSLRAYLGHRGKGLYVLVDDLEAQAMFRRAWAGGGHVWVWPPPPADAIHAETATTP